ncbi:MAG: class I mannose-6-phosphate isomerase, partial [Sphingomonadales bacterium]|nr:class I mannose-6-phosphate isomerase [Sphingomonadales bacterium]
MTLTCLPQRPVAKVWGRRDLPAPFASVSASQEPIGELHFEQAGHALLVKYLFTATKLSIQVHPDGEAARRAGLPHGKDEAWYILAAEEGAVIGIGLQRSMSKDQLRASALDGSIEQMLDWRPVRAGDVLYAPAGTVHAIGAGISLIEVQQNLDVTYRLFDYGRDRPLQLDEALAVAD